MGYFFSFSVRDGGNWAKISQRSLILAFFFILYFPWVVVVLLSFAKAADEKGNISTDLGNFGKNFSLDNYSKFFSFSLSENDFFWQSLINSFLIAFSSLFPALWLSLLTSFALWKRGGKLKWAIFKLSNLSISSPELIQGLSFMFLFIAIILPLGFDFGFFTIVLAHISFLVPYGIILIYPRLEKLNKKLLFVSYDLNCRDLETLFKVILPQLKGSIFFTSLVLIILSIDDFIITNLVKGKINTLSTQLYTMKKGVKAWALSFGSIVLLLGIIAFCSYSMFLSFGRKKSSRISRSSHSKVSELLSTYDSRELNVVNE